MTEGAITSCIEMCYYELSRIINSFTILVFSIYFTTITSLHITNLLIFCIKNVELICTVQFIQNTSRAKY